MHHTNVRSLMTVATITLVLAAPCIAQTTRQPTGTKARAELYEDAELERSKNLFVEKKESGAIEALAESGHAVEIRCGNKRGWVDRSELEYELPPPENCVKGTGSSRGSNQCR